MGRKPLPAPFPIEGAVRLCGFDLTYFGVRVGDRCCLKRIHNSGSFPPFSPAPLTRDVYWVQSYRRNVMHYDEALKVAK